MASTNTVSSPVAAASGIPAGISRYEDVANAPRVINDEMGQQQFLTLFTTQLKNQNPLDPVKNEAFVAQLAQFSQLEASLAMKTSMEDLVKAMSGERMLAGAALLGRQIAVDNAPVRLEDEKSAQATLDLPQSASGVKVSVLDSAGRQVRQLIYGAQAAGNFSIVWDGADASGSRLPNGDYRFSAQAVIGGKTTALPVKSLSTVRAVSHAADGTVLVEVDGGKTLPLADVQRIGQ
jgi:flagellar basal-body rod modification protein FlgD